MLVLTVDPAKKGLACVYFNYRRVIAHSGFKTKVFTESFPSGSVVKNPPANAGVRLDPRSGKIPRATGALNPRGTTIGCALEPGSSN